MTLREMDIISRIIQLSDR